MTTTDISYGAVSPAASDKQRPSYNLARESVMSLASTTSMVTAKSSLSDYSSDEEFVITYTNSKEPIPPRSRKNSLPQPQARRSQMRDSKSSVLTAIRVESRHGNHDSMDSTQDPFDLFPGMVAKEIIGRDSIDRDDTPTPTVEKVMQQEDYESDASTFVRAAPPKRKESASYLRAQKRQSILRLMESARAKPDYDMPPPPKRNMTDDSTFVIPSDPQEESSEPPVISRAPRVITDTEPSLDQNQLDSAFIPANIHMTRHAPSSSQDTAILLRRRSISSLSDKESTGSFPSTPSTVTSPATSPTTAANKFPNFSSISPNVPVEFVPFRNSSLNSTRRNSLKQKKRKEPVVIKEPIPQESDSDSSEDVSDEVSELSDDDSDLESEMESELDEYEHSPGSNLRGRRESEYSIESLESEISEADYSQPQPITPRAGSSAGGAQSMQHRDAALAAFDRSETRPTSIDSVAPPPIRRAPLPSTPPTRSGTGIIGGSIALLRRATSRTSFNSRANSPPAPTSRASNDVPFGSGAATPVIRGPPIAAGPPSKPRNTSSPDLGIRSVPYEYASRGMTPFLNKNVASAYPTPGASASLTPEPQQSSQQQQQRHGSIPRSSSSFSMRSASSVRSAGSAGKSFAAALFSSFGGAGRSSREGSRRGSNTSEGGSRSGSFARSLRGGNNSSSQIGLDLLTERAINEGIERRMKEQLEAAGGATAHAAESIVSSATGTTAGTSPASNATRSLPNVNLSLNRKFPDPKAQRVWQQHVRELEEMKRSAARAAVERYGDGGLPFDGSSPVSATGNHAVAMAGPPSVPLKRIDISFSTRPLSEIHEEIGK